MVSAPLNCLSFSLSLVLFSYILYVVTHIPLSYAFVQLSVEPFGRLGKPAMALVNTLAERAWGGGFVFKDGFVVDALRGLSVGCVGALVCCTSRVFMLSLMWVAMLSVRVLTFQRPKFIEDSFLPFRLIGIQPLLRAALLHSLCRNTHTHQQRFFSWYIVQVTPDIIYVNYRINYVQDESFPDNSVFNFEQRFIYTHMLVLRPCQVLWDGCVLNFANIESPKLLVVSGIWQTSWTLWAAVLLF